MERVGQRRRIVGRDEDAAAGLNYWFSPQFVVKLSYHHVDGNRFARPEEAGETLRSGGLDSHTNLVALGAQFSF